jgi:DNA modification methylase
MTENNALARLGSKNIVIGKFRLAETGLIVDGDPTYEEWEMCGEFLKQAEKAVQFWIGDWVNYGERKWGEMYAQALEATDNEYQTLANYKYVADNVDFSRRRENLSFSHHAEVAKLPPEQQEVFLEKASEQGLSVRELRQEIWRAKTQEENRKLLPIDLGKTVRLKVMRGDMLDIVPIIGKFDLIVADPPYNVTDWDWDRIGDGFLNEVREWLTVCKNALADCHHLFWFCSPKYAADTEMIFRELGLPIRSRIVWHRRNMAMGSDAKDKFIDSWEMILHTGNKPLNWPEEWGEDRFDVQTIAVPQTNFVEDPKYHPTQKPLKLIRWLVEYGSRPGERVLDPFAGSGTTGAAAYDRQCVLVEKEEEYATIIETRLAV